MKTKHLPFLLSVIALFLGIISPSLLSDGMFSDGVLYALISNNLANDIGSFWDLHATNTLYPHFNEHPPLVFGIQSMFFYLFGDSILVERIYSLSTFFITGAIIIKIWREISESSTSSLFWLPLLLWVTIPLVTWSATNNMLENTMMIFVSLSVFFCLKSLRNYRFLNITIAGILLLFGFLSKGFVALFPFSLFLWYYIFTRKVSFSRAIIDSLFYLVATIIPLFIIFIINPQSIDSLINYFNRQILGSLNNIQTVDNRYYILLKTFTELFPAIIIALIIFIIAIKQKLNKSKKMFLVFLFLSLSGVVPIMISMKQSGFYVLATFPFFSIAIALFIVSQVNYLIGKINSTNIGFKIFRNISYLLIIASVVLVLMQINEVGRDEDKIADINLVIQIVPAESTIYVQPNLWTDWAVHGYFYRYANISLDDKKQFKYKFVLVDKGYKDKALVKYNKIPIELSLFDLYKKK